MIKKKRVIINITLFFVNWSKKRYFWLYIDIKASAEVGIELTKKGVKYIPIYALFCLNEGI